MSANTSIEMILAMDYIKYMEYEELSEDDKMSYLRPKVKKDGKIYILEEKK